MTDLLITRGTVVDGTGAPSRTADVAISGGLVEAVGDLAGRSAARVLSAEGHVVCPGFVDVHTHSDLTLLSNPLAHSKIRQGVTTEVIGNCGLGVTPVAGDPAELRGAAGYLDLDPAIRWGWHDLPGYLDALAAARPSVNVAALAAHIPLRAGVVGFADRAAEPAELSRMCGLLDDALEAGAAGASTGLMYAPLTYAREEELVALGRTVASRDRLFSWHIRDYSDNLLDSVRQVLRVAETTGCRTQISHLAAVGQRNWGKVARALELIDAARSRGADVAADMYPYLAGNAPLSQLLPAWAQAGGEAAMRERLAGSAVRDRVREEWRDLPTSWSEVTVSRVPADRPEVTGRTLADLGGADAALDLLASYGNAVLMVSGGRGEEDLLAVLRHPATVIGSDGQALDPDGPTGLGTPHPRSYGCYPRLFGSFVRTGLLPLEETVRKCTGAAAARAGIGDRGELVPGKAADVVLFDPGRITDQATYADPQRYPAGIRAVVVNGQIVVEDGVHRERRPGTVLRH
ncbi:D-aminoacylase [Actinomadura sp. DC4]|uniref:N-acyl-D-amino-acid deacylase family protein n=1 Tax=Actinomadura sp. DC4 TaxID=3055069 RepID=UPI0025AFBD1D|nr:D-aminoacylase [Actinomadura sp. DC4]MDN3355705.1 D-aminoacylase [Actinomadura sp. DC4]